MPKDILQVGPLQWGWLIGGGDFGAVIDNSWFEDMEDDRETHENTFLMLLGVHAGQYPEYVEVRKVTKKTGEVDDIIRDRDRLKIPSSMTIVVPAWEIVRLLEQPHFAEMRRQRDEADMKKRDQKNVPEPESTHGESSASPPASDVNPTHREDFTRLLGAAARKPPQED